VNKQKISIDDVARRAKVSITTVSRVINKVPTVNKENLARVEEAIAFFKFKPNATAQRLAKGQNTAIGFVMPGYPGIFHSFYAIELIRGIGHACETLRLDLIFHITDGFNSLNTHNVGGVIFADIIENRKQVEEAIAEGIPCMVINNIVKDLDVSYIAIDNVKGGAIATDYLINLGHKRIATITGNLQTQSGADRFEGYQKTLKKYDLTLNPEYVYKGDYSRRSARQAAERFFGLEEPPTAIFAASDDMALEVISVAFEKGIRIPEDISIIGFDDNPAGIYGPIALTTIKQPLFQMAEAAVKTLNDIVTGKSEVSAQKTLVPELIMRDSCAVPSH
jgi:DNA-binding LacI/PurR family transcriptional regulator